MSTMHPASPAAAGFAPKTRIAVSLLFLMNGFVMGSWVPKIPEFKDRLGVSEGVLGLLVLAFGIGSLLLMPVAGALSAKLGSRQVTLVSGVFLTPMLLVMTFVPNLWTGFLGMVALGAFLGAMDVAMNANAIEVEKSMRRAIMSSCHAFWSLGGVLGAGVGGITMGSLGITAHAVIVTIIAALMLAIAWPITLRDAPHPETKKEKLSLPKTLLPWLVGIMALFSMVPEGAVLDWSALYLRNELGASVAFSGFAFAAFSATMCIMRFAGDLVRDRLGAVRTLRVSAAFALVGMLTAGFAGTAWLAILGFAVAGIGIANMVPIAFSAAGNMPGLQPGIGLSVVTFMGYSGILVAPSVIGFVAEHIGFGVVYASLPVLFIVVLLLSHHAAHADRKH